MLQMETLAVSHGQAVSGGMFLTIEIVKDSFQRTRDEMIPLERNFHHKIKPPSLQLQKPELPVEVRRKEQVMCSLH